MTKHRGFTIVELIMVMVIMGIISAIAIPRLTGGDAFSGSAFRNEIVSALRYAQKSAVGHRRMVCATLTASTVTLAIAQVNPATACATTLNSPDLTPYASRDAAVSASGALLASGLFFQPTGIITKDGAGTVLAAGAIGVTGQADIKVEGETGHVE